jgi:hypothetical protein
MGREFVSIDLTRGYVTVVDADDMHLVAGPKWYADVAQSGLVYAAAKIGGKRIRMHRLLIADGSGLHVDHVDGDGLNNRRSNLRLVTHGENMQNKKRYANNTSGFKGVSFNRASGKWIARIQQDKKSRFLGGFDSPEIAAIAYQRAASQSAVQ